MWPGGRMAPCGNGGTSQVVQTRAVCPLCQQSRISYLVEKGDTRLFMQNGGGHTPCDNGRSPHLCIVGHVHPIKQGGGAPTLIKWWG